MFFKRIFLPLIILELILLIVTSLSYFLLVTYWNINLPTWVLWFFPVVIGLIFLLIYYARLLRVIYPELKEGLSFRLPKIILFVTIPILTAVLFPPLALSIRYNFSKVLSINSINDVKANESPVFLEVKDWYVDRMRVIPFRTIGDSHLLSFGKHKVSILFLMPIFSRTDAYQSHAKAWLAIDYHKVFSGRELKKHLDDEFAKSSMIHFKKMNVRGFHYFEAYPRGMNYNALITLAKVHDYYKSGYINIYKGQDVDRDILSLYNLKYFLFLFSLVGISSILIISGLMKFFKPSEYSE